jgi:hypothetical protein
MCSIIVGRSAFRERRRGVASRVCGGKGLLSPVISAYIPEHQPFRGSISAAARWPELIGIVTYPQLRDLWYFVALSASAALRGFPQQTSARTRNQ